MKKYLSLTYRENACLEIGERIANLVANKYPGNPDKKVKFEASWSDLIEVGSSSGARLSRCLNGDDGTYEVQGQDLDSYRGRQEAKKKDDDEVITLL